MEIKVTLNKPYTEEQRLEFIVEQNHTNGFEIKETDTALEAWGLTEEEKEQQTKEAYKSELIAEMDKLDLKVIRPLRAKSAGTATEEDEQKIIEYEEQMQELRRKVKELDEPDL